ncbi:MAG: sigma-54-dependent Fis family transcriptional regulator [Acidobacteria bacterium]|nr:sigma-54-dependent Fis family transcriptional regulator [Acidobacteriota bacterium]
MAVLPTQKPRILVVDDERSLREMLSIVLGREGYEVSTAEDVTSAIEQIRRGPLPDLLISDLRMPDGSGVDVLRALKERSPNSVGLLLTAFASADTAVEAMRLGAVDYLTKPFDVADLKQRVARYLAAKHLAETQVALPEGRKGQGFVLAGRSREILDVISLVARVARTDASVLITGESGTGKEWTAREIHQQSARQTQPFVAVNCGAFTESILESELFGHMKGSFTGAVDTKKGLLESADRGTLFLDEVGETSLGMQVKLLRVLQERRFRRVGGTQELEADVRFIAATNRHLEEMVRTGAFREDFFFRINVISVRLPALRERAEDIPILAEQFLRRFAERMGRHVQAIAPETMRLLVSYRWPGNVRELENVMERGVALEQTGEMMPDSLPPHLAEGLSGGASAAPAVDAIPGAGFNLETHLQQIERMHLERALKQAGGVQVKAADLLGITFRQFRYLAKKYQIR